MVTITECTRTNFCADCDDSHCIHAGDIEADCPKWKCDNLSMDCENCEFLKEYKVGYLAEVCTMTNAEAIDVIRDYLVNKVDNEPMQKACQLAIKALSAEPQYHNTDELHKHYEHYQGMENLLAEPQRNKGLEEKA